MISQHIECLRQLARYVQMTVYKLSKFTGRLLQWHTCVFALCDVRASFFVFLKYVTFVFSGMITKRVL